MEDWKFASFIEVDKEFKVEGLNIWSHYWHCSDRKVEVIHPVDRSQCYFKEYHISTTEKTVKFLAGEFSNGQLGIFITESKNNGFLY